MAYVRIVGGSRDLAVNEGDGEAWLFLVVTDEFGSVTCRVLFDFTVAVYTEAGTASTEYCLFLYIVRCLKSLVSIYSD